MSQDVDKIYVDIGTSVDTLRNVCADCVFRIDQYLQECTSESDITKYNDMKDNVIELFSKLKL